MIEESAEYRHKAGVVQGLREFAGKNLSLLAPEDQVWQPTDFLPDLTAEDWAAQVNAFREGARSLSDEALVIIVGGLITEEALPSYAVSLNLLAQDPTGISDDPWARWMRGWTAEENRHGNLLNAYLRLTGRIDMRSVEVTIYHLLRRGFSHGAYPDLYRGLIYTSFQECATKITHANVGRMAAAQGDERLSRICQKIAADESRHEVFYTRVMGQVMQEDPAEGILSFRSMLGGGIAMPGRLMFDGKDPDLFDHFAVVAQRLGAYTVHDYAQIIAQLVKTWDIASRTVTGAAAKAQDFICRQSERYARMADTISARLATQPRVGFSWIHGRTA